ncbi:MAG: dephospho-CoA kinase [Tannerella sp.]|jgi:dephospho-CoA kinase|nr:dephospho-CoA kinase [Tannerella sp.]
MTTIGLTGGIGSGKSTVASLLGVYGISVYVADDAGKRLANTLPYLRGRLTDLLGSDIYDENGQLNRRQMASRIFNDSELLEQVNGVIHPEIAADFDCWKAQQAGRYAVLESAILFESGFDRKVDVRLAVYAPEALRLQRVMEREQASETEVLQRMKNQLSDEIKRKRADYVIFNDDEQALIPQVENLLAWLDKC